jgi:hypothetical protein
MTIPAPISSTTAGNKNRSRLFIRRSQIESCGYFLSHFKPAQSGSSSNCPDGPETCWSLNHRTYINCIREIGSLFSGVRRQARTCYQSGIIAARRHNADHRT